MRTVLSILVAVVSMVRPSIASRGDATVSEVSVIAPVAVNTYEAALERADLAVAKSLVNPNILKGEFGESIRDQTVGRYLHKSGKWHNISPRMGRQGLDHVSLQLNEDGLPTRIMVDETKFGAGGLGQTANGNIQLGEKWTSDRLAGLADGLRKLGRLTETGIEVSKPPVGLSPRQSVKIPLSETETAVFWREGGQWKCDVSPQQFPRVQRQLEKTADLLQAAADGRVDYPKRLFQVNIDDNKLLVTIRDGKFVDKTGGAIEKLPIKAILKPIEIDKNLWASNELQRQLALELQRKLPHVTPEDAEKMASRIVRTVGTAEEALTVAPYWQLAAKQAVRTGGLGILVAVPIEVVAELSSQGRIDLARVGGVAILSGASAALGSEVGNLTVALLIRTETGYATSSTAAELLGLGSASRFANLAGGVTGGGVAAIAFAYGGYWLGYYDLQTANRIATASAVGAGAGAVAYATTLSLVAAYGTASTGAAISSLVGVAAKSASLAWLGGGSLASGGFGVLGGTLVLGTGVGVVIVGVTGAVLYGFQFYDEVQDNTRIKLVIDYLGKKQTFLPDFDATSGRIRVQ
jgi:hypothetical protein